MKRAERAKEAARLRAQGLVYREIAERMGISITYAADLIKDPDYSKVRARKDSYRGTCEICGARTDGSAGRANAPSICRECHEARNSERNAQIKELWDAGRTAPEIAADLGISPQAVSGWLRNARARGHDLSLHRHRDRELWPLVERRWREGRSGQEIAQECGTTDRSVYEMVSRMREVGIDLPKRWGTA